MTRWLIEMDTPTGALFYRGLGDWCNNANHARRFRTQWGAAWHRRKLPNLSGNPIHVRGHTWMDR